MTKPTRSVREPRLIVEIAVVIACKLAVIFALWYLFFSPEHRTQVTPERVEKALFSSEHPASHAP